MNNWIGVDLDGTLFTYTTWTAWNKFGDPVPLMMERVRRWLAEKKTVKIFTARVGIQGGDICQTTGEKFTREDMVSAIQDHLEKHGLPRLECTATKDYRMVELWDDRCVQVIPNTGRTLAEEHEAEMTALRGKTWRP